MSRRRMLVALFVAVVLAPVAGANANPSSTQESGNPINDQGSSYHYRTYITSITPKTPGLGVEVLEFADRLLLRNHTGKVVTVYGYSGEPYARVQPNGATEQNVRSPAVYLNTNFYANVTVPPSASATAQPKWQSIDRTGELEWHDHRIHWMSPVTPPEVRDTGRRTKIFAWRVPIMVGSTPGAIAGELYWVPEGSTAPVAAIVALAAILTAAPAFVLAVRRRRARAAPGAVQDPVEGGPPSREAW
jgi:formylmethanofuran dehydrogenase subunit D